MTHNRLQEIKALGQVVWLDNLHRGLVEDGDLQRLIEDDGLTGVTSNPTIFEKGMGHSDRYDDDPAGAITALHTIAADGRGDEDEVITLAEMAYLYAEKTNQRPYFHLVSDGLKAAPTKRQTRPRTIIPAITTAILSR